MTDRFDPNIPADPANPAAPSIEGDATGEGVESAAIVHLSAVNATQLA
jgi:hypothetical protein